MKRKIISLLLLVFILFALCTYASEPIVVFINEGDPISFDVQPQIVNNRLLVPMRAIFEELGASVEWHADTMTIKATSGSINVVLKIGDKHMYRNNSAVELDVQPQIINDRTMIPLRAVAEAFGANVAWHDGTRASGYFGYRFVHIVTYDSYTELDIPKFDYTCKESYIEKYDNGEFIVYRYPLAEYGTKEFETDMSDLDVYDVLLEGYGYKLEDIGGDGDLIMMYSKGEQIVLTGYFNDNSYGRYVAIRKNEKDIVKKPSEQELFVQEVLKVQDNYFPKIDKCEEELRGILDREFEYDPDEDEELQDAMEFAKRQAMRDAVDRGQGNSFGAEYAASAAAEKLIPVYKEYAYKRFQNEKQNDYNSVVDMINNLINIYNNEVEKLAICYKIKDYASYLIK